MERLAGFHPIWLENVALGIGSDSSRAKQSAGAGTSPQKPQVPVEQADV